MFSIGTIYGLTATSRNNVRFATLDSKLMRAEDDLLEAVERIRSTRKAFTEGQREAAKDGGLDIGQALNLAQFGGRAIHDEVGNWIRRADERLAEAMVVGAGFEVEKG